MIYTEKEFTDIKMEIYSKEYLRMVKGTAKGYLKELMEDIRKEFGQMINFKFD